MEDLTKSMPSDVLDRMHEQAKNANIKIHTDNVAFAMSHHAAVANAAIDGLMKLSEEDLRKGADLFFIYLKLPSDAAHLGIKDGYYVVHGSVDQTSRSGSAKLMTVKGEHVTDLPMAVEQIGGGGGAQPMAGFAPLSAAVTRCSVTVDARIWKFFVSVTVKWC